MQGFILPLLFNNTISITILSRVDGDVGMIVLNWKDFGKEVIFVCFNRIFRLSSGFDKKYHEETLCRTVSALSESRTYFQLNRRLSRDVFSKPTVSFMQKYQIFLSISFESIVEQNAYETFHVSQYEA
jgi:hypothetical protein